MIKYMPIKGGGVNLIAYITFLIKLWNAGALSSVEEYAGTSAGSIVGGFMAAGYTPDELYTIMKSFDFRQIEDGGLFVSAEGILSERRGLHPGKWFENWADEMFAEKLGKPKATFTDLKAASRPNFTAVTTDLGTGDPFFLNFEKTPNVILSEALRSSMSIPFLIELFSFTQGVDPKKRFSDGGEALNYPISLFNSKPKEEVCGLYLHDVSNVQPPIDTSTLRGFIDAHFETLLSACDSWLFPTEKWMEQTAIIDTGGRAATNFDINKQPADIAFLEQSGITAAEKYLSK
jgi:predicted acylesterase/phospholipase RssA